MASLYDSKKDGVYVLSDANFTNGKLTKGFKGAGVLKAYATWCPHCRDKVEDFKELANDFKEEGAGLVVYVIEAEQNRAFSEAFEVEGFPTMLFVDEKGSVTHLADQAGERVHDVIGILKALCQTKKKCLKKVKKN
jgi:thiol-disulfide isomerase/thioredoxin